MLWHEKFTGEVARFCSKPASLQNRLRGLKGEVQGVMWQKMFRPYEPRSPIPRADLSLSAIRQDLANLADALSDRDEPGAMLHVEAALQELHNLGMLD